MNNAHKVYILYKYAKQLQLFVNFTEVGNINSFREVFLSI